MALDVMLFIDQLGYADGLVERYGPDVAKLAAKARAAAVAELVGEIKIYLGDDR